MHNPRDGRQIPIFHGGLWPTGSLKMGGLRPWVLVSRMEMIVIQSPQIGSKAIPTRMEVSDENHPRSNVGFIQDDGHDQNVRGKG